MHDAARVREVDREAHVDERAQQRRARRRIADLVAHRDPGEAFHREVRRAVGGAPEVVDRHDRRMFEPRLDPRLAQEPRERIFARGARAQPLERDVAPDARVVREQDLAHPAAAEHGARLVAGRRAGIAADRIRHRVAGLGAPGRERRRVAVVVASHAVGFRGAGHGRDPTGNICLRCHASFSWLRSDSQRARLVASAVQQMMHWNTRLTTMIARRVRLHVEDLRLRHDAPVVDEPGPRQHVHGLERDRQHDGDRDPADQDPRALAERAHRCEREHRAGDAASASTRTARSRARTPGS